VYYKVKSLLTPIVWRLEPFFLVKPRALAGVPILNKYEYTSPVKGEGQSQIQVRNIRQDTLQQDTEIEATQSADIHTF